MDKLNEILEMIDDQYNDFSETNILGKEKALNLVEKIPFLIEVIRDMQSKLESDNVDKEAFINKEMGFLNNYYIINDEDRKDVDQLLEIQYYLKNTKKDDIKKIQKLLQEESKLLNKLKLKIKRISWMERN